MEEIRNDNINNEVTSEIAESEEVLEVALANENDEEENATKDGLTDYYTESEMSGLTDAQKRRKMIYDKVTTGILIALLASPIAIVLYILLWFAFR